MASVLTRFAYLIGLSGAYHFQVNAFGATVPDEGCVYPGQCTAPAAAHTRVLPSLPRIQWMTDGGFCGAMSIQVSALSYGAWISQDLVRKANTHGEGHGNPEQGYEVLPTNVAETVRNLKLRYDEWDYTKPSPQAAAYKAWVKSHLVKGEPIIFFPMCKGDPHDPYPGSAPNGGHYDHVEPIIGIGSQHELDDPQAYDDDWLVHFSDHDLYPYYRHFSTLEDTVKMDGNCREAQPGLGRNEMYPCIDEAVTYGLAVTGLHTNVTTLRVSLQVDSPREPNVRLGEDPIDLHGTVTVMGVKEGHRYALYRFNGTTALPASAFDIGFEHKQYFIGQGESWTFHDPFPFPSNEARYYVAVALPDPPELTSAM